MQDDPGQAESATRLIESLTSEAPGFVSQITVVELNWVPGSAHGLEGSQIATVVLHLLRTEEIVIEQAEQVWKARRLYIAGRADLADSLIQVVATDAGCERTMTFAIARNAVRDQPGMSALDQWRAQATALTFLPDRASRPPVLPFQSGHSRELVHVVRDHDQPASASRSGEHGIADADGATDRLQLRTYRPCLDGIVFHVVE